jgi:hypothetical protein
MNRMQLHRGAVDQIVRLLRRQGLKATTCNPHYFDCDVLLYDTIPPLRISVRAARRTQPVPHRVVRRLARGGQRTYTYHYRSLRWNLHLHGQVRAAHPDFYVLVARREALYFIVPSARVANRATLQTTWPKRYTRRGWLWQYQDAWRLLRARQPHAA